MNYLRYLLPLLLWTATSFAQVDPFSPFSGNRRPPADTNPPVPGFTLWLHADDTTSVLTNKSTNTTGISATAGSRVGTWLDRSLVAGTNHLYQFDGESGGNDRRPALSNSWFNGKPAIIFGAASGAINSQSRLHSLTNNINFGVTTAITVLVCGTFYTGGDSFNCMIAWDRTSMFMRRDNSNAKMEWGINNGWITTANTFTYGKGYAWLGRYCKTNTTSHWDLFRNGNTPDSLDFACCSIQGPQFYALGNNGNLAIDQWLDGAIAEVVIWPFLFTDTQASNVNYYATNKYNFAP